MVAAKPTPAHPRRVSDEREQVISNPNGWRADVVALIASDADLLEYVRYSSYGVATSYPKGDYDLDGDVDSSDTTALQTFISGGGGWNLDFNRDGNTDGDDTTEHAAYRTGYTGGTGGRGTLSRSGLRNRLGYAGYQFGDTINAYHVRHRVYMPEIGRWTRRDPAGYVDGMGLYEYVTSSPGARQDSIGLVRGSVCQGMSCSVGQSTPARVDATVGGPAISPCPLIQSDPDIAAALQSLRAKCPALHIDWVIDPSMVPGDGLTEPQSPMFGGPSCGVKITIGIGSSPKVATGLCQQIKIAILHEIEHARQACEYGLCDFTFSPIFRWRKFLPKWNDPANAICREMEAYCHEPEHQAAGHCLGGEPRPEHVMGICQEVCGSLGNYPGCQLQCESLRMRCLGGIVFW